MNILDRYLYRTVLVYTAMAMGVLLSRYVDGDLPGAETELAAGGEGVVGCGHGCGCGSGCRRRNDSVSSADRRVSCRPSWRGGKMKRKAIIAGVVALLQQLSRIAKEKPQAEPDCSLNKGNHWDESILYAPPSKWSDGPTPVLVLL